MPYDPTASISSTKVINGVRCQLVQVPPKRGVDGKGRVFCSPRFWYGTCDDCGMCSEPKSSAGHAFAWIQRHCTYHNEIDPSGPVSGRRSGSEEVG